MAGIEFGKPSFRLGKQEGGIKFPKSKGVPAKAIKLSDNSALRLRDGSLYLLRTS